MAEWKSANMAAFLPDSFQTLVDTTLTVTSTVSLVLNAIGKLVGAVKKFLIAFPIADFASVLIVLVEQFKKDFLNMGIYACLMWDYPLRQIDRSGFSGESFAESFMTDLASSFDDTQDPARPTFNSSCCMLILVVGAPGLGDCTRIVKELKDAFGWWGELAQVYAQMSRMESTDAIRSIEAQIKSGVIKIDPNPSVQTGYLQKLDKALTSMNNFMSASDFETYVKSKVPFVNGASIQDIDAFIKEVELRTTLSAYPDWQSLPLRQIVPPLVDVMDAAFEPLIDLLKAGRDITKAITEFIFLLDEKIRKLQHAIELIETYIRMLDALLGATGIYALWVSSDTGVRGLVSGLREAQNPPFAATPYGFYSGIALVAGGPSFLPFSNLFKPIGG